MSQRTSPPPVAAHRMPSPMARSFTWLALVKSCHRPASLTSSVFGAGRADGGSGVKVSASEVGVGGTGVAIGSGVLVAATGLGVGIGPQAALNRSRTETTTKTFRAEIL